MSRITHPTSPYRSFGTPRISVTFPLNIACHSQGVWVLGFKESEPFYFVLFLLFCLPQCFMKVTIFLSLFRPRIISIGFYHTSPSTARFHEPWVEGWPAPLGLCLGLLAVAVGQVCGQNCAEERRALLGSFCIFILQLYNYISLKQYPTCC